MLVCYHFAGKRVTAQQNYKSVKQIIEERGIRDAEVRKVEALNEKARLELERQKLQAVIDGKLPASVLDHHPQPQWGGYYPGHQAHFPPPTPPPQMTPPPAVQVRANATKPRDPRYRELHFEEY